MAAIAHEELLVSDNNGAQEPTNPDSISPAVYRILGAMGRLDGIAPPEEPTIGPNSFGVQDDPNRNYSDPIPPRPEATLPIVSVPTAELEAHTDEIFPETIDYKAQHRNITEAEIAPKGLAKFLKRAKSVPASLNSVLEAREKVATATAFGAHLADTGYKATKNLLISKEHKNDRRKVALALGGLAVGYIVYKGYLPNITSSHGHEAAQVHHSTTMPEASTSLPALNLFHAHAQPVIEHTARAAAKLKHYKESLQYHGDSIWNHVRIDLRAKLGHDPSEPLLHKVTGRVLRLNHMNWDDARHMIKGQHFNVLKSLRQK